ncbi:hypothetical protein LXA43DRAFT_1100787 [Ganoderma leucocontextum]|nr:hypothetical protein LXA43DRAFT_1100787 [Ganoderma leucocontextum]
MSQDLEVMHQAISHTAVPPCCLSHDHPPPPNWAVPHGCPIHQRPQGFIERCTCVGPSPPIPQTPRDFDTPTSLSIHHAARAGSEESLSSGSVSSFDPSSELVPCEDLVLEQDRLRAFGAVARSIALGPSFLMPTSVDPMLSPLAPGYQSPIRGELVSQNINDLQRFLSADLDLRSLSEAWRRGLQAPIESSV